MALISKSAVYFIFVAIGLIITTANLALYASIGPRSSSHSKHPGKHHVQGGHHVLGDVLEKPPGTAKPAPPLNVGHPKAKMEVGHVQPQQLGDHHRKDHPQLDKARNHSGLHHAKHGDVHIAVPKPSGKEVAQEHPQEQRQQQQHHNHHHGDKAAEKKLASEATAAPAVTTAPLKKADAGHGHHSHPPHQQRHGAKESPQHKVSSGGSAKHRTKYVAAESFHAFSDVAYDAALQNYHQQLTEATDEIEQSSNKFTDIVERPDAGVRLPTSSLDELQRRFGLTTELLREYDRRGAEQAHHFAGDDKRSEAGNEEEDTEEGGQSYCDPLNADYTHHSDATCMSYLGNIANMLSIKPMSSILSSGRTIKFKVYYRHNNVSAVLKVSQKKFALEPASEVIALKIDRWLGFYRVPPVIWTPVPIDFLRAACAIMGAFYSKWFEKFVLHYDTARSLTTNCFEHDAAEGGEGGTKGRVAHKCLNVSLQLWMSDVRNAEETILRPSESYRKYLELPLSATDTVTRSRLQRTLPSGEANPKYWALSELMDEFVFDLVIGNTDRWFGHNSFALGGCVGDAPCARTQATDVAKGKLRSKSTMRLAFIDQGSSFYRKGAPELNPFAGHYDALCRFPRRTAERVLELMPDGKTADEYAMILYGIIRPQVPTGIFGIHNTGLLRAAGTRLGTLATHIRKCLQDYGEAEVKYFNMTSFPA